MELAVPIAALADGDTRRGRAPTELRPGRRPGVFERTLLQLRLLEHWGERIRFCRLVLTTPRVADWKQVRLPPALSFLYYPLRVARLLRGTHHTH